MINRIEEIKKILLVIKIIEIFRNKYDIDYYVSLKLINVKESMLVVDFIYLKKLIFEADDSVEIRVNG